MRFDNRLAFGALCLLSGSRWLLVEALPSTLPTVTQQALHAALLTVLFGVASRAVPPARVILPVLLTFTLPAFAFAFAQGHITPTTQTIVFAFTPAVVVFALAQQSRGFGPETNSWAALLPALAGALGVMLLIPATLPSAGIRLLFLVAAMTVSAFAAIRLHYLQSTQPILPTATLITAVTALTLGFFSHPFPWSAINPAQEALTTLLVDAPILLLTVHLLRALHPIPLATRFLMIPLISILQGLLLLRPHLTPALIAGLILIAGSVFTLLRTGQT